MIWAVDGSPSTDGGSCGDSAEEIDYVCVAMSDGDTAGIRCCNDDGEGESFCGYPPSTDGDTCTTHDFATAKATCEENGYRLCTAAEVLAGQTAGTGCSYDHMKVWSGTPCACDASELLPNAADIGSCTDLLEGGSYCTNRAGEGFHCTGTYTLTDF